MILDPLSERALLLAPVGRDSHVATAMLAEAGVAATKCETLAGLVEELAVGVGFVLVTEEALGTRDLGALSNWIAQQPEWSDLPFILLTRRGGGLERNPAATRFLTVLGNVTFLERPFHPTTLISVAQSALRARRRQYDARARLEELRNFSALLEERVKTATEERETALAQLHEAQKLETLGQLTGGVAHDFNNLLTPITGALDFLNRRYASQDERSGRLIGGALESAERARTLVQRLLGFARRQVLQTIPVDLGSLISGMRDLIASSVGPQVELSLRCEPDLPAAMVDPNQLELAILNLCVNARDAMPGGGALTVTAQSAALSPGQIAGVLPGLYLQLSVIDTGVGMDADTAARAIEPFYSTKDVGKGTGLGLSMVHGLASQLGGGFQRTSKEGQGTRIDLWLPAASRPAPGQSAVSAAEELWPSRSLTILLVDDEPLVRTATAEMLREIGHEVREASSGQDALDRLLVAEVDIVVTDYMMPRMNGADLAARIQEQKPGLPVLLITGYAGSVQLTSSLPRLDKPFRRSDLQVALYKALDPGSNLIAISSGA